MVEQKTFEKFIGSVFGQYRLERLVEESYSSPVFLAQTEGNTARYLVRLLFKATNLQARNREEYLASFQYKAGQIAALQHPYLLPIVDYGVFRGIPFLVSPQISMRSLRTRLDKNGPMAALTAGRYLDQICTVLEYVHQHGVIHEGLSVDCLYLRLDGQIVVANLGLASLLEPYREGGQIDLHSVLGEGTAPEQLLGKPVGSFTDVYALGAVLYHLLTGSPVFSGGTPEEIAQQQLYASIPPLSQWRSDLPSGLYSIFARAMAKNPAQRFYQPGAVANAYHRIVDPNNRTRVPFVVNSSPPVPQPQREAASFPRNVQITELVKGTNGAIRPAEPDSSPPMIMQTPFPAVSSSFSESAFLDKRSERLLSLQRRLGRRSPRTTKVMAVIFLLILLVSTIFGVSVLARLGAGGASPSAQVTFFDSQNKLPWTTDSLSIVMRGLNAPQSGYHYEAWLINNDSEQVIVLGIMTGNSQSYTLRYNGSSNTLVAGQNLLSPGDKIEITLENGVPKQPAGNAVLAGSFPAKSFAHITHLLVGFPETPDQIGMLVGLVQQTHTLNIQGDILEGLAASKDTAQIHCAAQNMINIIEGIHGSNYRPITPVCSAQMMLAGDGFGLLGSGFLAGTAEHATLAISQPDATSVMRQHAALMEVALSNIKSWVTTIDQDALHLRDNPTDLTQVNVIVQLADYAYHGVDANGDGQIDPVAGEAGALTAFLQGQLMATLSLTPSA